MFIHLEFEMQLHNKQTTWLSDAFLFFVGGSACKESACNAGNLGSIPGIRRFPGEGIGYTLQYSCLENSMT